MATPDAAPILEMIDGFRYSQTLFAAVRLGIFEGARPAVPELARLLDACVSLGLLARSDGEYSNTALADAYLKSTSPRTLAGYIQFAAGDLYAKWGRLAEAVAGDAVPAAEYRIADFMSGMQGFGMLSSPKIAEAFDLSGFTTFVDLGGSTGHLALALQDRYPHLKIGVFDKPDMIEHTEAYTGGRAALYAGDFFADPLPAADLYGLGKILHNLIEEKIPILLGKICAALPAGGALLVAERLLDDDHRGPKHVHMSSLNMLVASHGRERTFADYREWLETAGFKGVEFKRTGAPVDAVMAYK